MRIVVTGASGFVGRPLVAALARAGHAVTAVVRTQPALPLGADRVKVLGDLARGTDWAGVLMGADAVIHLAGRAHVMRGAGRKAEALYREANVGVSEGLAEACVASGVRRLVFVSSIKVNGEQTHGIPFTNADVPAPLDAYGRSKRDAEARLREIAQGRMELVILRPPLMYGPGVRGNLAQLISLASRGVPLPLGSIQNRRDLLSVHSFAGLLTTSASHEAAAGKTFLARDGAAVSTGELYRRIAQALGKRARLFGVPAGLLRLAASLSGMRSEVNRLIGDLEIDDGETRRVLGWVPEMDMDEELAHMARWYVDHLRSRR